MHLLPNGFTIFEDDAVHELGNALNAAYPAPGLLGLLYELEGQTQEGCARDTVLRPVGAVSHGREGRLDRIGRAQMHPVLGWEVIEGEQVIALSDELVDRLGILCLIGLHKATEEGLRRQVGGCHPYPHATAPWPLPAGFWARH